MVASCVLKYSPSKLDELLARQLADQPDRLAEAREPLGLLGPNDPDVPSFIDSPVPTPRMTRPGARQPRVANAWATIAGL